MGKLPQYEINQWSEISSDYEKRDLLIGNGASIALHQEFNFES